MQNSLFDVQVIEPSQPIKQFNYWCGKEFLLEHISVLEEKLDFDIGCILVTGEKCDMYMLSRPNSNNDVSYKHMHTINVRLPKGHKKGGQSAPRFQRMYLSALEQYNNDILQMSKQQYCPNGVCSIKKLIISGNGIRTTKLASLIKYVDDIVTCSYTTLYDILQHPFMMHVDNTEHVMLLTRLLEVQPDILVFGSEIRRRYDSVKTIYTCSDEWKDDRKAVFMENDQFLMNFGSSIGVLYFDEHVNIN